MTKEDWVWRIDRERNDRREKKKTVDRGRDGKTRVRGKREKEQKEEESRRRATTVVLAADDGGLNEKGGARCFLKDVSRGALVARKRSMGDAKEGRKEQACAGSEACKKWGWGVGWDGGGG